MLRETVVAMERVVLRIAVTKPFLMFHHLGHAVLVGAGDLVLMSTSLSASRAWRLCEGSVPVGNFLVENIDILSIPKEAEDAVYRINIVGEDIVMVELTVRQIVVEATVDDIDIRDAPEIKLFQIVFENLSGSDIEISDVQIRYAVFSDGEVRSNASLLFNEIIELFHGHWHDLDVPFRFKIVRCENLPVPAELFLMLDVVDELLRPRMRRTELTKHETFFHHTFW